MRRPVLISQARRLGTRSSVSFPDCDTGSTDSCITSSRPGRSTCPSNLRPSKVPSTRLPDRSTRKQLRTGPRPALSNRRACRKRVACLRIRRGSIGLIAACRCPRDHPGPRAIVLPYWQRSRDTRFGSGRGPWGRAGEHPTHARLDDINAERVCAVLTTQGRGTHRGRQSCGKA